MSDDSGDDAPLLFEDLPATPEIARARSRVSDGKGVGPNSHLKYGLFQRAIDRLVSIHFHSSRGRGLLVDMHAHEGGVITQRRDTLFGDWSTEAWSSSRRLVHWKKEADAQGKLVDLVLCEKNPDRRAKLAEVVRDEGVEATILKNNKQLLKWLAKQERAGVTYGWGVVTNDPCGVRDHGVDVLIDVAQRSRVDFVIVVNEHVVSRLNGVRAQGNDTGKNAKLVKGVRNSKHKYDWVLDCREWAKRLGRKRVLRNSDLIKNPNHHGRVLVLTNHPTLTGTGFEAYTI